MSTASSGQPLPPPPPPAAPPSYAYPPITIILTIILLIFFFVGFFSIYFCRCFMQNILYTWHLRHSPAGTPVGGTGSSAAPGLDPTIIQGFPTFTYANVKQYKTAKCGLECAICLIEFDDNDMVRHLLVCDHVFHKECIDLWLESHKTCPVCRRNLDVKSETLVKSSPNYNNNVHENNNAHENNTTSENNTSGNGPVSQDDNFVSITIKGEIEKDESTSRDTEKGQRVISCSSTSRQQDHDDHDDHRHDHDNQRQDHEDHRHDDQRQDHDDSNNNNGQSPENKVIEKFSRSNTTGHSIFRDREEEDRFTLRLPQHVKLSQLMKGHHKSSLSWNNYGEYSDIVLLRFLMEKSAANVSDPFEASDSDGEISSKV